MRTSDWTFVLALPTSRRQFEYARAVGEYCHEYEDWYDYNRSFLALFGEFIEPLESAAGLRIVRGAPLQRYCKALTGSRGVILFSHCNKSSELIEFTDGMSSYHDIANRISPLFCGIADFSVCSPCGFDAILMSRAPDCAVRLTEDLLFPQQWFRYYGFLLSEFAQNGSSYAEAILRATALFDGPGSP